MTTTYATNIPTDATGGSPTQQWFQMIAGVVATAIQVTETLQRARLVFDANDLAQLIEQTEAGHAVPGSSMTKEQAQALQLLTDTFAVYLNTPMVEGGLKPIQVLYRQWPLPITE